MRRYMSALLALAMVFAVAGCGGGEEVNWDGNYYNENGYLVIGESTGKNFAFAFLMNDGKELRGMAEAEGNNAEYGDLDFSLSGDNLVVTLDDDATDASGLNSFLGTYMVNNVGTMVDEGSPEEMGIPGQVEPAPEGEQPVAEPQLEQPVLEQQPEVEQPVLEQQPEAEQPVLEQQPETEQPVVELQPEAEQPVLEQLPEVAE